MELASVVGADEVLPVIRVAWQRSVGGHVNESKFEYVCESIAADILEDGIPASADEAKQRFEELLVDCAPMEHEELEQFSMVLFDKLGALMERIREAQGGDDDDTLGAGMCEMCEREVPLTRHHLIPRTMHKRYLAKGYLRDRLNACAMLCRSCHSAVHHFFSEKVLAETYNTIEKLMEMEEIRSFAEWQSKQPVRSKRKPQQ